jgi:hypothetical protein
MTQEEFNNLKVGDRIIGNRGEATIVRVIDTGSYEVSTNGLALLAESWELPAAAPSTLTPDEAAVRNAELERILEVLADTQTDWGNSRWSLYAKCPMAHHLRHNVGVVSKWGQAAYFGVGQAVHAGLQYMQLGVMRREQRDWRAVLEYCASLPDAKHEELDEAYRLLEWYFNHWGTDNAGWHPQAEIIGVEGLLEAAPDDPIFPYTARYDTLLMIGGEHIAADTKTRAMIVPGYKGNELVDEDKLAEWKRGQAINPQFLGQSYLLQKQLGLDTPPDVLVNCIMKTKVPSFVRVRLRITQTAVDRWAANQANVAHAARLDDLRTHKADGDSYRAAELMRYQSCVPYIGDKCTYFSWCHGAEESRELHYVIDETRRKLPVITE